MRITGTLKAPVDNVWEIWTQPQHIAKWWSPTGLTNTVHSMEVAPGDRWLLTIEGPDGKTFHNRKVCSLT